MSIYEFMISKYNNFSMKKYIATINKKGNRISKNAFISKNSCFEGENGVGEYSKLIGCKLGYASYLGDKCTFYFTEIGRYCSIANDVSIVAGRHPIDTFVSTHPDFYSLSYNNQLKEKYIKKQKFEEYRYHNLQSKTLVSIGSDVWIGAGVRILDGISIGDGAVIGTGAVITKDIPPYAIVAGVPGKIIRYRFDFDIIEKLLNIAWWDKDTEWNMSHADDFSDVDLFIKKYYNK